MKYELVLFDADGTLFDFDKASEEALRQSFREFEIDDQWNSETLGIYKKVNKKIWDEFELKMISAEKLKVERFNRFLSEISITDIDFREFSNTYLFLLSKGTYLLKNAEEIVKWCYGKFKMGIVTNGLTSVQKPRFSNSIIYKYFDHYIISEEIGFAKPNTEIFDHSFNLFSHSSKETAIIIGDNLTSDIKGGNDYGIDTCWFNFNELPKDSIVPTYEINNLLDLKSILMTK